MHVRAIPYTPFLISSRHSYEKCANMEIFDISKKGRAMRIYIFGEVTGGKNYSFENVITLHD